MGLFISYSSRDAAALAKVTAALRRAHIEAWLDEELTGGEAWWNAILEQIRDCEVFIVALSKNYLESKPCQAELRYAQELNRPILPVQIGPLDACGSIRWPRCRPSTTRTRASKAASN